MKKLQALVNFLTANGLHKSAKVDAWVEEGEFTPRAKDLGTGMVLLEYHYECVIQLEGFTGSAATLSAFIAAWMIENASQDDGERVGFSADKTSDKAFDVEITLEFRENVEIVEDLIGPLPLNGKRWNLAEPELWVAEEFELVAEVNA